MRIGKLDNDQLERLILSKFKHTRSEVKASPRVGVDCAAVELSGRLAVLSTDPITSASHELGALTVHVSCNDAAAAGAEPVGLLVTLLVPPHETEESIARVADELSRAAQAANVEIIGGHTEVTDSVTRMVTCATVLAKAGINGLITPDGMREDDDIVLTKHAGLEGTAVIATDLADRLPGLSSEELLEARAFMNEVSVVREGLFAAQHGAHAMHDVTEGGVLGAVWEMAYASGCGVELRIDDIPVHPITRKVCDTLAIDPYRLLSSGCMLIACSDGASLCEGLRRVGVCAAVIGRASGKGVRLADGGTVAPPGADELYKLLS